MIKLSYNLVALAEVANNNANFLPLVISFIAEFLSVLAEGRKR